MSGRRGLAGRLAAWARAALVLALCGCALAEAPPWRTRGGGGRPEGPVRSSRASRPEPEQVRSGQPAYGALGGNEARALARRLDPASQSLRSFADLAAPLRASLEHLSRQRAEATALEQPGGRLSYGQLRATLRELLELLPRLDAEPGLLAERFVWYELAPRPLVTGYYTPEVEARLGREPGFEQPLYRTPPDLRLAGGGDLRQGRPAVYRVVDGGVTAYPDRRAIDMDGALAGRGLEIAWVRGPLDAFLLQTEGAGVLRLADGSRMQLQYAAGNGRPFTGLGTLFAQAGVLAGQRQDRAAIRAWCEANPQRAREILAGNRSYVFFEERRGPSLGALEKPLTPLVTLATDPNLLPLGAVAAMDLPLPDADGGSPRSLRGLVLAQDTGAAIRGHRLDLYLGGDGRAERMEASLRAAAGLHLLVSKKALAAGTNAKGP